MIQFAIDNDLNVEEFQSLLVRSGLAERRPIQNQSKLQSMLENADLIVTARWEETLVGVARSVTDFVYCCYLADLAVDRKFQSQGIGGKLMEETQKHLHPDAELILLSPPSALHYYTKKGFKLHSGAFTRSGHVIPRKQDDSSDFSKL